MENILFASVILGAFIMQAVENFKNNSLAAGCWNLIAITMFILGSIINYITK